MRRQAVVNANVTFRLRLEGPEGKFETTEILLPKGHRRLCAEKVGADDYLTEPFFIQADRRGRDRDDLPDYNVKITACLCFSRTLQMQEYYHNSSWLENGGAPEKAVRSALTSDRRVHQVAGQVHQKRNRHQMAGRAGLPGARDELLLHANLL